MLKSLAIIATCILLANTVAVPIYTLGDNEPPEQWRPSAAGLPKYIPPTPARPPYQPHGPIPDSELSEPPVMPLPAGLSPQATAGIASLRAMFKSSKDVDHSSLPASAVNAPSQFTRAADFTDLGWTQTVEDNYKLVNFGLETAFGDMGISSDPRFWKRVVQTHSRDGQRNGQTYKKSGAMATNIFNPQQGVIVTGSLLGNVDFIDALVQQGSSTRMAEVSPLRYWHDLCYLAWASLNGGNAPQRKAITHIFYHDVQDAEMRRLLTLLVDFRRQRGYDRTWPLPPTWQGVMIKHAEDKRQIPQAAAVLDIFKEITKFITTHEPANMLGDKGIDRIHVFACPQYFPDGREKVGVWCVYFHLRTV